MTFNTSLFFVLLLLTNKALLLKIDSYKESSNSNKLFPSKENKEQITEGIILNLKKVNIDYLQAFLSKEQKKLSKHLLNLIEKNNAQKKLTADNLTETTIKKASVESKDLIPFPIKNYKNTQYIANIQIGTPPQEIPVILDTGSGNLWINSSECKSQGCVEHKSYNRHLSSTFSNIGLGVQVTFGSGLIVGEINQDTISLGGISVHNQVFGEIINETGDVFSNGYFSGILGLGFQEMAAYKSVPIMDNIKNSKILKNNVMSFYYTVNEDEEGQVTIGTIDHSKYTGNLDYFPVNDKFYWSISLKDIKYNNQSLNLCKHGCKAIIDTGTTLITGPPDDLNTLLKSIPVGNDCENYEKASTITFIFQDINGVEKSYSLDKEDYIFKENKVCNALMMPLEVPEPHGPAWIFGDVFMQKFFTVFDKDNSYVGFAVAKHKLEKK